MKTFFKLLLLAAVALPSWLTATAQEAPFAMDLVRKVENAQAASSAIGNPKKGPFVNQLSTAAPQRAPQRDVTLTPETTIRVKNLTVASGSSTNKNLPIRGGYYDNDGGTTRGQMIYPSSMLTSIQGKKIRSLTFHTNSEGIKFGNVAGTDGELTVKVGITSSSNFGNANSPSWASFSGTPVTVEVTPKKGNTQLTVTFDTPFTYSSGNLLVDVTVTTAGTYGATTFIGNTYSSNYSLYQYGGNSRTKSDFLPQITIAYESEGLAPVSGNQQFFHSKTYTWKENGVGDSHTGYLDSIAYDPDQIIAMLRKVYMDPTIPGNLKRSALESTEDTYNDVPYTGAGELRDSSNYIVFSDKYGWNIPGEVQAGNNGDPLKINGASYQYWYMNPEQYRPDYDGVTLLLLEMVDDFDNSQVNVTKTGYAGLREYFEKTIKSARVLTESMRTGEGEEAGTLFKIDCDRMNKFYLIAKGQLERLSELWYLTRNHRDQLDFYQEPCYIYGNDNNSDYNYNTYDYYDYGDYDQYVDSMLHTYFFLGHMFEQFSPAEGDATITKYDIYQDLTKNMQSFGVVHDCPNVPYVETGHHFMMYGYDSGSDDCQDVRDMLFFVPDYRMKYHSKRGTTSSNTGVTFQDYFRYNPDHQPTMGMFVILQDSIPGGEKIKEDLTITDENAVTGLFKHQLQWTSNLHEFLPTDDQYYELWEIRINDYGIEEYVPVYYRNEDGEYKIDRGGTIEWVSDTAGVSQYLVPIILNRNEANEFVDPETGRDKYNYLNVYVDMKRGSQTKTYVIQGRDNGDGEKDPFLTLQMSNRQSVTIPGTDPNEKVKMIGTTHYSRFNAETGNNCYSNKLQITDNTLTTSDLSSSTSIRFERISRPAQVDANGNVVTDANGNILYVPVEDATTDVIATGTYTPVSSTKGTLTVTIDPDTQDPRSAFPGVFYSNGDPETPTDERYPSYLDVAGYHANAVNSNNQLTFEVTVTGTSLNFNNCMFWDNFVADAKKNAHPFQYEYRVYMGDAYSNKVHVGVFKTDGKTNQAFTLDDVLGDKHMGLEIPENVEYEQLVQYGSKTELLRYDAYRWLQSKEDRKIVTEVGVNIYGNDVETDVSPEGQANNEGTYYTTKINVGVEGTDAYYGQSDNISPTSPRTWAKYVDEVPLNAPNAYDYVPVIETFNFGYRENKENNKIVERTDYNTYGGPTKSVAIGKMEVKVFQPDDDDVAADPTLAQMSKPYKWYANGNWYSYYNFYLEFTALDVPTGYELYKVRAWRKVDKSILGEELSTRADRINNIDEDGWYLFEDINYGDQLGDNKTMSCANLKAEGALLGHRSTSIAKPVNPDGTGGGSLFEYDLEANQNGNGNDYVEQNVEGEMRATFGALRMDISDGMGGTLTSMKPQFKVRAYFTKSDNPLANQQNGNVLPTSKPIYVLGNVGSNWNPTVGTPLYSDDGITYSGTYNVTDCDNGHGLFRIATDLAQNNDNGGWDYVNGKCLGAANSDGNYWVNIGNNENDYHYGDSLSLAANTNNFRVPVGQYNLSVNLQTKKLVIKKGSFTPASAPRRATALPGSDFDYYVAEGTVDDFEMTPDNIITGISAVKMDVNREVVGVSYVNTIGQVSSTPWQGVNIVVTRYSDGSTTTRKVIK